MAKRPNPRAIRANLTYTVAELAEAQGVSVGCVRGWVREGLPTLKAQRPLLIHGAEARDFLTARRDRAKSPLADDELYCPSCKAGRRPWGMAVDLILQPGRTARVTGLCEVCTNVGNRMVAKAKIPELAQIFDVAKREGPAP